MKYIIFIILLIMAQPGYADESVTVSASITTSSAATITDEGTVTDESGETVDIEPRVEVIDGVTYITVDY
jgi:hypothetical protein